MPARAEGQAAPGVALVEEQPNVLDRGQADFVLQTVFNDREEIRGASPMTRVSTTRARWWGLRRCMQLEEIRKIAYPCVSLRYLIR